MIATSQPGHLPRTTTPAPTDDLKRSKEAQEKKMDLQGIEPWTTPIQEYQDSIARKPRNAKGVLYH
jgi:hypothetical protein